MGDYNPNAPLTLGIEWAPLIVDAVPLGRYELGYTFEATVTETLSRVGHFMAEPLPTNRHRSCPTINIYKKGDELAYGDVRKTICAVTDAIIENGSVDPVVAGIDAVEALSSPSDTSGVLFNYHATTQNYGRFKFDIVRAEGNRFEGRRILDVAMLTQAIAYIEPGSVTPDPLLRIRPEGEGVVEPRDIGHAPITFAVEEGIPVARVGLEVLYAEAGVGFRPMLISDLAQFDESDTTDPHRRYAIANPNGALGDPNVQIKLFYLALEVTHCRENRQATGCILFDSYYAADDGRSGVIGPGWQSLGLLYQPDGTEGWEKQAGQEYLITVQDANMTRESPLLITNRRGDMTKFTGAPPHLPLITSPEVLSTHEGRIMALTEDGVPYDSEPVAALTPIQMLRFDDPDYIASVDSHVYAGRNNLQAQAKDANRGNVHSGSDATQRLLQRSGGTDVPYHWVRFWVRKVGETTADLVATCAGSTATLTVAAFDLLTDVTDGWKQVTLEWDDDVPVDNTGTIDIVWSTTGTEGRHWQVLHASALVENAVEAQEDATYGGSTAWGESDEGTSGNYKDTDFAVTISQAQPAPTGFSVSLTYLPLTGVDEACPRASRCAISDIQYVNIEWDAVATTGFDHYEIQRRDDVDPTWRTIARLTDDSQETRADREVRRGVESEYRMRVVRIDGIEGTWTSTLAITLDTVSAGPLIFTSNVDEAATLVYTDTADSGVRAWEFPEAGQVAFADVYGRDFPIVLRPTERGGVAFSRTIVVNRCAVASTPTDRMFQSLRDLAWDDLPYVCVMDGQGSRWFATVIVPDSTIRNGTIHIATLLVRETSADPYSVTS